MSALGPGAPKKRTREEEQHTCNVIDTLVRVHSEYMSHRYHNGASPIKDMIAKRLKELE